MFERGGHGICAVCARQEAGHGVRVYQKVYRSPVLWLCDDDECINIAKAKVKMKQDEFNKVESQAVVKGGEAAGAFLETIGKSDLAKLNRHEWHEFCHRLVAGYRKSLKDELKVWS